MAPSSASSARTDHSLATSFAIVLFGTSSWLCVNAVWVELPILVNALPEQWELPSFLAVIVQLAVVGPIVYSVADKLLGDRLKPSRVIYAMLVLGVTSTMLLAMFWNKTVVTGSKEHSVALFALYFLISITNCTSNVLFLPYMYCFKPRYVTIYFIGMGFSGLIPSALALIQGAKKVSCIETGSVNGSLLMQQVAVEPLFSVTGFLWIMAIVMMTSLLSFGFLDQSKLAKKEHVTVTVQTKQLDDIEEINHATVNGARSSKTDHMSSWLYWLLLALTTWVCALVNGILPSIQSYSCLPYGQQTYHLTVALSSIANPVASFAPLFFKLRSTIVLVFLAAISTCFSGFILFQAATNPSPVLVGQVAGSVLTVTLWCLVKGLLSYQRTVMASLLRRSGRPRALFWCGVATQFGSFFGAVVFFPLISIYHVFKTASVCGSK